MVPGRGFDSRRLHQNRKTGIGQRLFDAGHFFFTQRTLTTILDPSKREVGTLVARPRTPLVTARNIMSELPEDLSKVIQAWSELPEHVRETIVTLVNKAAQEVAGDWSSV